MRVMVLVKANEASEAGEMPSAELFEAMNRFNQELADAGVLLEGFGLQPTSRGRRVRKRVSNTTSHSYHYLTPLPRPYPRNETG